MRSTPPGARMLERYWRESCAASSRSHGSTPTRRSRAVRSAHCLRSASTSASRHGATRTISNSRPISGRSASSRSSVPGRVSPSARISPDSNAGISCSSAPVGDWSARPLQSSWWKSGTSQSVFGSAESCFLSSRSRRSSMPTNDMPAFNCEAPASYTRQPTCESFAATLRASAVFPTPDSPTTSTGRGGLEVSAFTTLSAHSAIAPVVNTGGSAILPRSCHWPMPFKSPRLSRSGGAIPERGSIRGPDCCAARSAVTNGSTSAGSCSFNTVSSSSSIRPAGGSSTPASVSGQRAARRRRKRSSETAWPELAHWRSSRTSSRPASVGSSGYHASSTRSTPSPFHGWKRLSWAQSCGSIASSRGRAHSASSAAIAG